MTDALHAKSCITDPVLVGDTSLNILLYADDLVLISESRSGLQSCLDILSDYCLSWKLQVNTDKSKVLIFNSNGKTYKNEFKYLGVPLETVQQYCYLGIIMKYNGNFNIAISSLVDKARKALFKVKRIVGLNNPCKLLEKLFDTMIVPILLYGSEIWGLYETSCKESESYEKLHLKFIKEILGVHCKVTNDACRAELCRLPLRNIILQSSFKFLAHIQSQRDSLAYKIYKGTGQSNHWVKNVKKILNDIGFSFIGHDEVKLKPYINAIKQRLTDQFLQMQNANIENSSKLHFFKKFFLMNKRPEYVDKLINKSDRSMICKLRISAHPLAIEKGRYSNVPRSERFCNACKREIVEDEEHFLLHCSIYREIRTKLHEKLIAAGKNINSLSDYAKLKILLNDKSSIILKLSSSFISNCFEARKSFIE